MTQQTCGCTAILENRILTLKNGLIERSVEGVDSIRVTEEKASGSSTPFMNVEATLGEVTRSYRMWPDLPVIRISDDGEEELLTIQGAHWILRSIKLRAFTDDSDTLVEETVTHTFRSGLQTPLEGELFFLEDLQTGQAVMILSETPDFRRGSLSITQGKPRFQPKEARGGGIVRLKNGGDPVVLGFCKVGECEALCRAYYRHVNRRETLVTMSNTWGDAHGTQRVCDEFIRREIDAAKEIGVDIVQIDDGWQVGGTVYPYAKNAEGERIFEGDCWDLNTKRFPKGVGDVTDYAAKDGIRMGLWFAPYSKNEFEYLERDWAILKKAYEEWGIRFFKLDMYQVTTGRGKQRLLELLHRIDSLGPDVSVQMDVTRYSRLNYLCGAEYGTIFVENRYTELANSFPHRVLRNLWTIGRFLPTTRFQFELVNPDLNPEYYNEGDPFVPSLFGMDYLFACVMLCNPLFWMEMQFLSEQRRQELAPIMKVFRQIRGDLAAGDVCPVGEKPSGRSLTGFSVSLEGKPTYLLLFREVTEREEATFVVPGLEAKDYEVLASNTDVDVALRDGAAQVRLGKERGYALIKLC